MFRLGQILTFDSRQRTCLLLLVVFCASLVPMPVGRRVVSVKDGALFPCQGHACGCRSAEQCWRQCCCFSPAAKLAWARANNVRPPDFVLAAAAHQTPKSCCAERSTAACDHPTSAAKTEFVIVARMRNCRGEGLFWHALPWAIVPKLDDYSLALRPIGWQRPCSCSLPCAAVEPPDPPPRLA